MTIEMEIIIANELNKKKLLTLLLTYCNYFSLLKN